MARRESTVVQTAVSAERLNWPDEWKNGPVSAQSAGTDVGLQAWIAARPRAAPEIGSALTVASRGHGLQECMQCIGVGVIEFPQGLKRHYPDHAAIGALA